MFDDISHILDSWKFSEHDITVRLIQAADGRSIVQMRIDLGILQMELDGRPDGRRPRNHDTYLHYFETKAHLRKKSKMSSFVLSPVDCFKLQQEAIQFYHRYLALMKLKDYSRVSRDTRRNLRVLDFVEKYAENDEVIWQFQQHRPYVIMMNIRAKASIELDRANFEKAVRLITGAIDEIERYNEKWNDRIGRDSPEIESLHYWLDEISGQKPLSEEEQLNKELKQAVFEENYEKAAELRDRLALLK